MKYYLFLNCRCFLWLLIGAFICLFSKDFAIKAVLCYGIFLNKSKDELLNRKEK